MNQESVEKNPQSNPETELKLQGRTLWLTKDPELIRVQLEGVDLANIQPEQLAENVSTDEIIKSEYCFYFTPEELGEFALTGFRGGVIKPGDIKKGNFEVICAGPSFGCGSSREHAPISLKGAGIKFILANPIERIFLANSQNQGLYPIEDFKTLEELLQNKKINREKITTFFDPISADIVRFSGLLPYLKARIEGKIKLPEIETPKRPMTMVEKIIASHMMTNGSVGVEAVKPGGTGFVKADFRYGYELSTPLGETALKETFAEDYKVSDPGSVVLFEDHTALAETLKQNPETGQLVYGLLSSQRKFAKRNNLNLYPPNAGICHNVVVENHALPSQVILGTDSHTCSAGVVGAFANGIGATEMAGSWLTKDVRVTVPETWRFNFKGKLHENVMAKDVMLYILSQEKVRKGQAVGRVFEYGGTGLDNFSFDELFVLPNMAVEGGAFTGIVEPNEIVIDLLLSRYPKLSKKELESMVVKSDEDAQFEEIFEIDLYEVPLMVATPGDPKNGVPLKEFAGVKTDAVYIGSCTGGKLEDLKKVAEVLAGKKVKVPTYVQASSLLIRKQAERLGLIEIFRKAGVTVIDSGCGDCCNLGFGIVESGGTIVSDTNRNFPGRMGDNNVHLVNPAVAATVAVTGYLTTPDKL